MNIIAFNIFVGFLGVAIASASPSQIAQRLRGNQEARDLVECTTPRTPFCKDKYDSPDPRDGYKPTSYISSTWIRTDDKTFDDWYLGCPGIPMWEAGNSAKTNPIYASDVYINWDCRTGTLCVLVKARQGFYLDNNSDNWLKDYEDKQDPQESIGVIQMISEVPNSLNMVAWEACYEHVSDCLQDVEIHANFHAADGTGVTGRTTSTGKINGSGRIALDLTCPCESDDNCRIDACYTNSKCNTVNQLNQICEYKVLFNNCCNIANDDDDCAAGFACVEKDGNGVGECIYIPPTTTTTTKPATTGGSGGSTTAPPECTTNESCSQKQVPTELSSQCVNAVCISGTCGFTAKESSCVLPSEYDEELKLNCVTGGTCTAEGKCVATYQPDDTTCASPDHFTAKNFDSFCVESYKCKANTTVTTLPGTGTRTTCEPVFKPATTNCTVPGARGLCDSGDKCNDGYCVDTESYKPNDFICRDSVGPCDAPEYCPGDTYTCPDDKKYGPGVFVVEKGSPVAGEKVCRKACDVPSCTDDVPEECPGGEDACPVDVFFEKELDLIAGQKFEAGNVTINAADLGEKVEVCVTIKLENGWKLQNNVDSIKMDINNVQAPGSAPGSYAYKDLATEYNSDTDGVTRCYSFPSAGCTIYFAIHLDVKDASGVGQTAWAKAPAAPDGAAATSDGSLTPHVFVKQGTKGGPKVKVTTTTVEDGPGWGNYFTFSICCATDNDKCPIDGGAATTTVAPGSTAAAITTTVAPGSTTTTAGNHVYKCTGSNGVSLDCKHSNVALQTCDTLFN